MLATRKYRRTCAWMLACGVGCAAGWTQSAPADETVFTVTQFADPPWSLVYYSGFTGQVGTTAVWPSEMGWQGDVIDIEFFLPSGAPADALHYLFTMNITDRFVQEFDVSIQAGPSIAELAQVHLEHVNSPRTLAALIPLSRVQAGQWNWIRIQGIGVAVGAGQPSGIQWDTWTLARIDAAIDLETARLDQLQRLKNYVVAAIQPSGLVRDSLPLSPTDAPFHPASPDAGGFALLALCAADRLGLLSDAEARVETVLSAYAGHQPGVTPLRNVKGHWWHWLDLNNGGAAAGWGDAYTTIGSALLISGAGFARNHFSDNAQIASLAEEMAASTDFDAAIHASLDGRVFLATNAAGGEQFGSVTPWNEYMLIVSLALQQPAHPRATAVASLWLDPAMAPTRSYAGIPTLTDNPGAYAPAFWVHQQHFFNADFANHPQFETYFYNHRLADRAYCTGALGQAYRYGLTAGVNPSGYSADRIASHNYVFSPEAVAAWGDLDTLLDFLQAQPPASNPRYRYGMVRASSLNSGWIPFDAGLVDHLFLMFGLTESIEPLFFRQRLAGQVDVDADGIADAYDNCPANWNRLQVDSDADGLGDACTCGAPFADSDGDGDVDLADYGAWQRCAGAAPALESCLCLDRSGDHRVDSADLAGFAACMDTSGPLLPADPQCGQ